MYQEFCGELARAARQYKIRIAAWCLMKNHYHLLLQNNSGRISEFMKHLNSTWAKRLRKKVGGKGYVFQGRFKSTLIDETTHWETAFCYVLLNPVRAGIVDNPWDYPYSSLHEYFVKKPLICDNTIIKAHYPRKSDLSKSLEYWNGKPLNQTTTRTGPVLGSDEFISAAMTKFNRRQQQSQSKQKRLSENSFESPENVLKDFEKSNGTLSAVNLGSFTGKRLRAKLLVALKDRSGMKYSEIILLPWFKELKLSSLGRIYGNSKNIRK
jgi:REP element-mobilizing transposase RayT